MQAPCSHFTHQLQLLLPSSIRCCCASTLRMCDKLLLYLHRVGTGWRPAGWRTDARRGAFVRRPVCHLGGARHRSGASRAQGATSLRRTTPVFNQCSEAPFGL